MCPHGYHHSGSMATPALGTRDVYIYFCKIINFISLCINNQKNLVCVESQKPLSEYSQNLKCSSI